MEMINIQFGLLGVGESFKRMYMNEWYIKVDESKDHLGMYNAVTADTNRARITMDEKSLVRVTPKKEV